MRPPTPPPPGDIIIKEISGDLIQVPPPLIIRQEPKRPITPPPLVIREKPPKPPSPVGRKLITIKGKQLPPPPRKVIIERLAELPPKPQSVIIERWLPYKKTKRRVIFQKEEDNKTPVYEKPKNLIIEWTPPVVKITKVVKNLGVLRTDPKKYIEKYGDDLKKAEDFPQSFLEITNTPGIELASDCKRKNVHHELEGDLFALNLIDLEKEGLSEYKCYLGQTEQTISTKKTEKVNNLLDKFLEMKKKTIIKNQPRDDSLNSSLGFVESKNESEKSLTQDIYMLVENIFNLLDKHKTGKIEYWQAEYFFTKLNDDLNREHQRPVSSFFHSINIYDQSTITMKEFKEIFLKIKRNSI